MMVVMKVVLNGFLKYVDMCGNMWFGKGCWLKWVNDVFIEGKMLVDFEIG